MFLRPSEHFQLGSISGAASWTETVHFRATSGTDGSRVGRASRLPPALPSLLHFWLRINAEGVRDAIDVVEVGDDLHSVDNIAIAQAVGAQSIQVGGPYIGRRARHFLGELAQSALPRRKRRAAVVLLDLFSQFRVAGFLTEILSVRLDSIEASVDPGNDRGQHLALNT